MQITLPLSLILETAQSPCCIPFEPPRLPVWSRFPTIADCYDRNKAGSRHHLFLVFWARSTENAVACEERAAGKARPVQNNVEAFGALLVRCICAGGLTRTGSWHLAPPSRRHVAPKPLWTRPGMVLLDLCRLYHGWCGSGIAPLTGRPAWYWPVRWPAPPCITKFWLAVRKGMRKWLFRQFSEKGEKRLV